MSWRGGLVQPARLELAVLNPRVAREFGIIAAIRGPLGTTPVVNQP